MGRLAHYLVVVFASLVILILVGCSGAGAGNGMYSSGGSGTSTVNKSMKLYDSKSDFIGYVTQSNALDVSVYTTKGYFVNLTWAGTLVDGVVYFTGANATGTPFYSFTSSDPVSGGLTEAMNGRPYVPALVNSTDLAVTDTSISTYQSVYISGTITNESNPTPLSTGFVAYLLSTATLTQIGLPSSLPLPLPLSIEFQ